MNNKDNLDRRTLKRKIGDLGETIACRFLMKHGYVVVDRNYLRKCGELDIVAVKANFYYFFEVKTVSRAMIAGVTHETGDVYKAEDNIHPWKLQRLSRTIQIYIIEKKLFDVDWKFNIITVSLDQNRGKAAIHMLENIVL